MLTLTTPTRADSVESLAASLMRMTSTETWTPARYRGAKGKRRALEDAVMIRREATAAGIDEGLLAGVLAHESGMNPSAKGAAGERGLGQVFPSDWRHPVTGRGAAFSCDATGEAILKSPVRGVRCCARELAYWSEQCRGDRACVLSGHSSGKRDSLAGAKYAKRVLERLAKR